MRQRGIAGSPVLIGAATVLVAVVAIFLSYNANNGLPFVPTYQVRVEAPSAANLVRGNEVRIGGARVGAVDQIEAKRQPDGSSVALLTLKLDKSAAPLAKDSTVIIRPKSVLGQKYVEITRGTSSQGFRDGDTIPITQLKPAPVEFDEVANMFDARTRAAIDVNLQNFGDALAGRGESINQAIGALRPLLRDIVPVAKNLSASDTHLVRFVQSLARAAQQVAPVAQTQADLFVNLDTTFAALRRVARPYIQDTISEGPATLDEAIKDFPQQRPFLVNATKLFGELRPGIKALGNAAPDLADALRTGTPTLRRSVALNKRLKPLFGALQRFAEDPLVPLGVKRLRDTLASLNPTLQHLAPVQTTCNYVYLWFRNVASLLSEGDANGTWQRFIIVAAPHGPNSEAGNAAKPADGPTAENHLHTNYYPNTASPGQPKECEAGNEGYAAGKTVIGNVDGTQKASTEGSP